MKLNIACGQRKEPGWVGIDAVKTPVVDIIHNLNVFPWPIESGVVQEAYCSHYIEHIPMTCACCADRVDLLFQFFDELYRIMADEAKCTIIAPYWSSARSWQDPTHRRAISECTFLYTNKGWRVTNLLDHYPIMCDFSFTYGYILNEDTAVRAQDVQAFWLKHYVNSIQDVTVTLTKRPRQ